MKSGGEAFLLGTAKVAINSADYVTIVNNGGIIQWSQPYPEAMYNAEISSPKKESKLKGKAPQFSTRLTFSRESRILVELIN